MEVGKGILKGAGLIILLGGLIVGIMLALVVALIITGIMNDTVVPALGLGAGATGNITAVINTVYDFIGNLNSGVAILGALVLIVIVIAVFGAGYMGYKKFSGKGGSQAGNF